MPKRWITDLALTVILLPLMGYSLIGEAVHEWLGLAMLALIVLHHIWNHVWYKGLDKGRMSIYRAAQTLLTFLLLLSVIGSLFSGLVLWPPSRPWIPTPAGYQHQLLLRPQGPRRGGDALRAEPEGLKIKIRRKKSCGI